MTESACPSPVPVPGVAAEDAVAALDDLATYSLTTRDAEGEAFLVHRLVQDVTRRGLEQAGGAQGANEVLLPVPSWLSYGPIVQLAGGRIVELPTTAETDFGITAEQLRAASLGI